MKEPKKGAQIPREIEGDSIPSGSVPLSENVPLDIGSQYLQQHKSKRVSIQRCRFEIEGEAFMCAP